MIDDNVITFHIPIEDVLKHYEDDSAQRVKFFRNVEIGRQGIIAWDIWKFFRCWGVITKPFEVMRQRTNFAQTLFIVHQENNFPIVPWWPSSFQNWWFSCYQLRTQLVSGNSWKQISWQGTSVSFLNKLKLILNIITLRQKYKIHLTWSLY